MLLDSLDCAMHEGQESSLPDKEVEDSVDGAPEGVLYGQHRSVCQPLRERLKCHLKLVAGQRLGLRACFARCALTVRPWHTLICNPALYCAGCTYLR